MKFKELLWEITNEEYQKFKERIVEGKERLKKLNEEQKEVIKLKWIREIKEETEKKKELKKEKETDLELRKKKLEILEQKNEDKWILMPENKGVLLQETEYYEEWGNPIEGQKPLTPSRVREITGVNGKLTTKKVKRLVK